MGAQRNDWEPIVDVDMLIRRPAEQVWEAFVEPAKITKFWLGSSSGRLTTGATVRWRFKIAGAETDVRVVATERGRLLDLRWDEGQPLLLTFTPHAEGTIVHVRVTDFGSPNPAAEAIESMSGFTLMLASLKLWLEYGIAGDLQYDKFPDAEYVDR